MRREPERGSRRREEDIGEKWPDLPDWATADELDLEVRRDLRGLSKEGADWVAAHLVAASTLADEEPETAWRHARAARARGGRIGVVRETVGLVAYRAGEWAEAIGELRAARRMGGGPGHLAVLADCERALGHPEKAIELSRSTEADELDPEASIELSIVVAGARADLDQVDVALANLERLGLDRAETHPRLAYAYADLLLKAGRQQEALSWFIRSANADADEETDALDRVAELSDEDLADENAAASLPATDELLDDESLELPMEVKADQPPAETLSRADSTPVDEPATSIATAPGDANEAAPASQDEFDNEELSTGTDDGPNHIEPTEDSVDQDSVDQDSVDPEAAHGDNAEEDSADQDSADQDSADPEIADPEAAHGDSAEEDGAEEDGAEEDGADGGTGNAADVGQDAGQEHDVTNESVDVVPPLLFSDDTQAGDR